MINIDDSLLGDIEKLNRKYKQTYGKEVNYSIIPKGLTQEKLVKVLELMISDNLSLLVAYEKLYSKKLK